jgi:hypothetical protein
MSGFETTEDAEFKIIGSKWFPIVPHGTVGIIAVENLYRVSSCPYSARHTNT